MAKTHLKKQLVVIVVATVAIAAIVASVNVYLQKYQVFVATSDGMAPTIVEGSLFRIEVFERPEITLFGYGDILAFRSPDDPETLVIKRVVGLPGDELKMVQKKLFRNGETPVEPYATNTDGHVILPSELFGWRDNMEPVRVPAEHLFLMGDNRDDSRDCRYWGPLAVDQVYGRVIAVLDAH